MILPQTPLPLPLNHQCNIICVYSEINDKVNIKRMINQTNMFDGVLFKSSISETPSTLPLIGLINVTVIHESCLNIWNLVCLWSKDEWIIFLSFQFPMKWVFHGFTTDISNRILTGMVLVRKFLSILAEIFLSEFGLKYVWNQWQISDG